LENSDKPEEIFTKNIVSPSTFGTDGHTAEVLSAGHKKGRLLLHGCGAGFWLQTYCCLLLLLLLRRYKGHWDATTSLFEWICLPTRR
jgi:hypothetical protein